jgi:branched-subunit amino acid transport protein
MSEGWWLWLTLFLIGCTTMLTRGSFIIPGERARLPPVAHRVLRYAPAAALAALIAPDLLLDDGAIDLFNPKLLAGLLVVAIAWRSRNPWLPFILGMGALLAMRKLLGW